MKLNKIRISDDGIEFNGTLLHDHMPIDSIASVLGSSPTFISPPDLDPPASLGVVAPVHYLWNNLGITVLGTRDGLARTVQIFLPDPGWEEGTFGGGLEVFGLVKQPDESGVSYFRRLLDSSQAGFFLSPQSVSKITETSVLRYERSKAICQNMNIYVSNPKNPPRTHNNGLLEYLMWRDVEKPIHFGGNVSAVSVAQSEVRRASEVASLSKIEPAQAESRKSEFVQETKRIFTRWIWKKARAIFNVLLLVLLLILLLVLLKSR